MRAENLKFCISHELRAPEVIAPDYLFGLDTSYPFTLRAIENCGILQLSKNDYVEMLQSDKVFLYNILNYLSRNSQMFKSQMLQCGTGDCYRTTGDAQLSSFTTQVDKHRAGIQAT